MITLVEADKFAGEIAVIGGGSSVSKEVRDAFIEGGGVIAPEVTKETACLVFTPSIHGNARRNMGGRTRNWEKAPEVRGEDREPQTICRACCRRKVHSYWRCQLPRRIPRAGECPCSTLADGQVNIQRR